MFFFIFNLFFCSIRDVGNIFLEIMKTKKLTLAKLQKGKDAIITAITCNDRALKQHILNMGLTPGVEVTMIKAAPMGDPIEIKVRGYNLTIRKADASTILLEDIHDAHNLPRQRVALPDVEHTQKGEKNSYLEGKSKIIKKGKISFALVGNQNSGKTTLFNKLTGSNQHVGNFPGVTVDKTQGIVKGYKDTFITDLPGIYSLSPYTNEEIVSRNFILDERPDAIINIVDVTNIERSLLLTMQLIELEIPMVIALNMMDELENSNGSVDINGLEETLGVPVVAISAAKSEGINELMEHAVNVARYVEKPKVLDFCSPEDSVHKCIHSIMHFIHEEAELNNIPIRFAATKLAEGDNLVALKFSSDKEFLSLCEEIITKMEQETGMDRQEAIAGMRFSFIESLCSAYVIKPEETEGYKISAAVDKVLTGKFFAIPSFLLIMAFIFYLTFGPVGSFLTEVMEKFVDFITYSTDTYLTDYGLNPVVKSLIINGIFAGVGSVLVFLPWIILLFFCLSILEDTGYMARVAFFMDRALRKIGLSGRSFVPMLIGFGCSVPAILATRTLPSERDRKMTILLTPFMSCSAKLPIYALFTAAFFKEHQILVIIGLYLIGVIVGLIVAYIMKIFVFKDKPSPFVLEIPNYRLPNAVSVYRLIYLKAKGFITKAFTVIFFATIIIWFLQTFDTKLNLVTDSSNSLLAMIGSFVAPIFSPLGLGDWKISTAFITGFMAKENVISTLGVLGGDIDNIPQMFDKLSTFVFLVFCLLYTPCVAAIATVKRELGKLSAFLVIVMQCSIAWFVAFIVYKIGLLFV